MTGAVLSCLTAHATGLEDVDLLVHEDGELGPSTDLPEESCQEEQYPLPADAFLESWGADPDLWLYRDRTVGLLKRYMRLSVEVGRLPSLLGREFFRTRVTSYHVSTFEDTVIFVHDVETSLGKLDRFRQEVIAKLVLQEYSQGEVAQLMQCATRTISRHYLEALDELSEIFLRGGILTPLPVSERASRKSCQEGGMEEIRVSDCIDGENIFGKCV
jgi:hypothetical protein